MSVIALAETHTFWSVALGLGAVVVAVVIVLMMLLLSFLKDIERSAAILLEVGGQVGANTANITQLAATGPVLEMIKEEALIHDGYLASQVS
jgi:hypothetical protein